MLVIPIKKQWFDMIKNKIKTEEYREIKPYWTKRFISFINSSSYREFDLSKRGIVIFQNGYSKDSPRIKCEVVCKVGFGKPEWGAESDKEYYILKILNVM